MIESPELPAESRVAQARAEFVATLGRRLTALHNTLRQLEEDAGSRERRDMLLRRVHALGAAARVLAFDGVAEALSDAERALARSAAGGPVSANDLAEVSRSLDLLPSIAWGAKVPSRQLVEAPVEAGIVELGWPLGILVYGPAQLRLALVAPDEPLVECEVAEDAESFRELAQRLGPDVAVIDGDRAGAAELLEILAHDPLIQPFPAIVVGTFEQPEAASHFVALGAARVLPKPVGPDALQRAVLETARHETGLRGAREPLGDLTLDELAARIAVEIRRGLVDGADPPGASVNVPLGEGTDVLAAIWGSVARIRELVTMRSGGAVRFHGGGPEGAVPLAGWTVPERRAGERLVAARRSDGVRLEGRRAVVVDDDPAIVWFLTGLMRTSGVEVAEAHDGLQARDFVFEGLPDLVISDVLMPGLDGFSLCREIKRDIAVSDVPVILLSWKEDLLQRVRELGVSADGYLRKEAAASTVLQRIREVLRPRARIEARLAAGGEVRGRIDGLTMRLILELTKRYLPSSRIVVRDSVYLYELEIRDGRPRRITRTATDGSFERGARVVDALVGVNAGRFVVAPNSSPCRDELDASLDELLKPRIQRARLLSHLLDANQLDHVQALEIDADAIAGYVAATPEPARRMYERLLAGEGPRSIVAAEPRARLLLEQVLLDVVRHGAVRRLRRDDGPVDLDAGATTAAMTGTPRPEETSPPLFTLELSPAPPEVENVLARWEQPLSARLPLNQIMTPLPPPEPRFTTPSQGFRDEPGTNPGVGPPSVIPVETKQSPALKPPPKPARAATPPRPTAAEPSPEPEVAAKPEASNEPANAIENPPEPSSTENRGEPILPTTSSFEKVEKPIALPPDTFPEQASPEAAPATEPRLTLPSETPEPEPKAPVPPPPPRREPAPMLPSTKPIEFPARAKAPESKREFAKAAKSAPRVERRPTPEDKPISAAKIALLTLAAAAISFGIVTLVRNVTSRPAPPAAATETAAASVSAPAAAAPKPAAAALTAEELGLPPGVPVGNDKGLLEVEVGGRHAVYVDGTFVGRGPTRRIPLAPGPHQVMVKLPEGDSNLGVDLKVGRRTRVALPGQ